MASKIADIAKRLRPLGNRVLVRKAAAENVSAGGIILSEAPRTNEGTVLAVGPGYRGQDGNLVPMNVAVGDTVYLPDYGGVKINGADSKDEDEYTLFREDELLGTLSPDA